MKGNCIHLNSNFHPTYKWNRTNFFLHLISEPSCFYFMSTLEEVNQNQSLKRKNCYKNPNFSFLNGQTNENPNFFLKPISKSEFLSVVDCPQNKPVYQSLPVYLSIPNHNEYSHKKLVPI